LVGVLPPEVCVIHPVRSKAGGVVGEEEETEEVVEKSVVDDFPEACRMGG